jgi:AAT family amino acid transporter
MDDDKLGGGAGDGGFGVIAERERGLRRGLSTGQLSMIAIGGAIGTGLFLGSGFAIGIAGPSVLVSYGIGALIALLLMGCLAEMAVVHPTTGSFGAWAEGYLGPMAGFMVRYAYWAANVLAAGTEVTAVAVYMGFWYPAVPGWVWIVAIAGTLITINLLHVKVFGVAEYGFSAMKILAIVVFLVLGAWVVLSARPGSGVGFANYVTHGGFFPHGAWGMWSAVLVALFSYFGIEMIAVAAGEAEDPQRAITRAFRATFARLAGFYLLTLGLILAIVPWNEAGHAQSPFVTVMERTHIPHAAGVVNLILLVAALSAMNSQMYITTRMMFSLARAGHASAVMGRISRRGVPVAALLLSTLGIALGGVLTAIYHSGSFLLMVSISSFGAMFTWLMIFVTHLSFRRAHEGEASSFRMIGYPYTSIAGIVLMGALLLTTPFTAVFRWTLASGVPFLVLLVVVYRVRFAPKGRLR